MISSVSQTISHQQSLVCRVLVLACVLVLLRPHGANAEPLFPNSIVSNDLDFIKVDDPKVAFAVAFQKQERKEMPDKRSEHLFVEKTYVFQLVFADDVTVEVWANSDFASQSAAEAYVRHVGDSLGKLPKSWRTKLSHVVLHNGDEVAFSEADGHFLVLYAQNMDKRLSTHDLDETVFHETIHAVFEKAHAKRPEWLQAQKSDRGFITAYAAKHPQVEDLPESALFTYTLQKHPGRLSPEIEKSVKSLIPARLSYLQSLFKK